MLQQASLFLKGGVIAAVMVFAISSGVLPAADAFYTSSEGGVIVFSIPCQSSRGLGFWTLKANNPMPVVYLYPSWSMRKSYLAPMPGVTTLGLVGSIIDCTTFTIPPVTLTGRMSTMYGTAFTGF